MKRKKVRIRKGLKVQFKPTGEKGKVEGMERTSYGVMVNVVHPEGGESGCALEEFRSFYKILK